MFKFIIGGRRRAGMTHRDYSQYAQLGHGGIVVSSPSKRIDLYIQSHVIDAAYGTEQAGWYPGADFDSFSELWFADPASMQQELASDYYQSKIKPDEPRFTDSGRILVLGSQEEEQPVAAPRNGLLKVMRFLKRANGVSYSQFGDAWRRETARIASHPALVDPLCRYVRSHALEGAATAVGGADEQFVRGTPINVYDGVESLWFAAFDDLSIFNIYRKAVNEANSHIGELLDHRADIVALTEERQILPVERKGAMVA